MGTPAYIAPEVFAQKEYDGRVRGLRETTGWPPRSLAPSAAAWADRPALQTPSPPGRRRTCGRAA